MLDSKIVNYDHLSSAKTKRGKRGFSDEDHAYYLDGHIPYMGVSTFSKKPAIPGVINYSSRIDTYR